MSVASFGEVAGNLRRSTVLIHAGRRGNGSGVIWTSDGLIVTNAHVARGAHLRVQLWDARELDATLESFDAVRDVAVLRVNAKNLPAHVLRILRACVLASWPSPLAILWIRRRTHHRESSTRLDRFPSRPAILVQAGVRLAPGNSGGPLADARGASSVSTPWPRAS